MDLHVTTTGIKHQANRLSRFISSNFLILVVGFVLVVALMVVVCGGYKSLTPDKLSVRDLLAYRPLLLSISIPLTIGALLLPWLGGCRSKRDYLETHSYRHYITPLLCLGAGYINLLLGVKNSLLAIQLPFLLGMIIDNPWEKRKSLLRPFKARAIYPLALSAILYVLYTGIVTLGWSSDTAQAFTYWRQEVWLLVIPSYFFIYDGFSKRLAHDFWMSTLRIAWVYIVTYLVFLGGILISCGVNPLVSITFNKNYLQEAGFVVNIGNMLMPFQNTHYTYLGVYLLIPVVMTICSSSRSLRKTAQWVLIAIAIYACVNQARYVLLMAIAVEGYALTNGIQRRLKHTPKPTVGAYLMLAGAILLTLVYNLLPNLAKGYLAGGVRTETLQVGYEALKEIPLMIGGGLNYAHDLLLPLQIKADSTHIVIHCHNQYVQSLLQSGIIGLLLWIALLGSMLWIAYKQRNQTLIVVTSLWIILCNVDLVSYLPDYLIGMLFVICLALTTKPLDQAEPTP